jgi:PIN domain associated with the TPR-GreAB-C-PIN system
LRQSRTFHTLANGPKSGVQLSGLDRFIAELKERSDWLEVEYESYSNGPWPIEVLAHRIGLDCIDAAAGLASHKRLLKVAIGNVPEREAATAAVRANGRKGCVLDLLSFWTAWRLNALSIIVETCGPISLPRSVVDRLLARREKIASGATAGLRSAHYENGRLVVTETTPEVFQAALDDIDHAVSWAEANTRVCPLVIAERLPLELREPLKDGHSFTFDSLALAIQEQLILITDDQSTRELARALSFIASTWLHNILSISLDRRGIGIDTFIRTTAELVNSGHNYLGINGAVLARSAVLDAEVGVSPGPLFHTLSKLIGGKAAEPQSHGSSLFQVGELARTSPAMR